MIDSPLKYAVLKSQIVPREPLSSFADAFHDALMTVELGCHLDSLGDETGGDASAIEHAIADAVNEYCGIGLDRIAIVKRLLDHI